MDQLPAEKEADLLPDCKEARSPGALTGNQAGPLRLTCTEAVGEFLIFSSQALIKSREQFPLMSFSLERSLRLV